MGTENNDLDFKKPEPEQENAPKRKNPLNLILIGLIVAILCLLALQVYKINQINDNIDDMLIYEDDSTTNTEDVSVELSTELFDGATMLLDFSDITLSLENESIRSYYDELTDDLSNFVVVYDKRFVPSSSILVLRYKETSTSICFYNEIVDDSVYCAVINKGVIIGTYLIPSEYYYSLFDIIHLSDKVTEYTANLLKEDLTELIADVDADAIHLDENHSIVNNGNKLETFESKIKNKENATVIYALSDNTYIVICYMNFKYYVFLTDADGNILQEGDYNYYALWENDYLYCYNTSISEISTNFVLDGNGLSLKVLK